MSECSSCGAEITWATTEAGKKMPLDAESKKGVVLAPGRIRGIEAPEVAQVVDVYTAHFASCPNAGGHRKEAA